MPDLPDETKQVSKELALIFAKLAKDLDAIAKSKSGGGEEDDDAGQISDFNKDEGVQQQHTDTQGDEAGKFHSAGVFDCRSDYWSTVFEAVPSVEPLLQRYMDSRQNFLFTGMYMFCASVREGETKLLSYEYDHGVYYSESKKCAE